MRLAECTRLISELFSTGNNESTRRADRRSLAAAHPQNFLCCSLLRPVGRCVHSRVVTDWSRFYH
jgi:hypothetical protein